MNSLIFESSRFRIAVPFRQEVTRYSVPM
jgi:hypothetical protein